MILEFGSGNAENVKIRNSVISLSEFHIHLHLSSVLCHLTS